MYISNIQKLMMNYIIYEYIVMLITEFLNFNDVINMYSYMALSSPVWLYTI